ncbi:sulfatase [Allorhodopirellula solitaria]|uniref:Choline-sulfatase n=1 Tax=Allorhodopirellula solitaria TaxID=2527987 RepID=A0A5C5X0H5_9BACT|nr:sulfatase [Allorhodopirellula solitaria]TWT55663.1 Choline-sulfatase [Allorhodopirellula solitaria]
MPIRFARRFVSPAIHRVALILLVAVVGSRAFAASGQSQQSGAAGKPVIAAAPQTPNVLFIAIDDMNDWTGFLGGHPQAHTPNMDALARRGVSFTNAHCVAPACSPCRLGLLYGVEPFHSGLYPFYNHQEIQSWVTKRYTSLPKTLRDQGFETFGAGKIFHSSAHFDIDWSDYHKPQSKKLVYKPEQGYQIGKSKKMAFCPTTNPLPEHPDYQVADYGIDVINREHDKPFFLAVGIVKPHLAFVCPEQFFDLIEQPVEPPPIQSRDLVDVPWVGRSMAKLSDDLKFRNDEAWQRVRHAYLACNAWADFNIGRVLDALAASPHADNTVVVLWSDHGYHQGEKRSFRKFSLWEESTRVPLIIYDPRRHQGEPADCVQPVSLIDLYRTVDDLAGVETPSYVDGDSLLPQLNDPTEVITEPAITTWGRGNYSLRDARYRYTRYYDGGEELYDHQTDPQEWNNLAEDPDHQDVKQRLAEFLPQNEAPLHREGVGLWNVIDADRPSKLKKFQQNTWPNFAKKLQPEIQ